MNPYELHPWLAVTTTVEDYVSPDHYDRLLQPYRFGGVTDLDIFRTFLNQLSPTCRALELGPGTGRATRIFRTHATGSSCALHLVDLSTRMLTALRERMSDAEITYHHDDALQYLTTTTETFDCIYSLWSFSHAVHQSLTRHGLRDGSRRISATLDRMARDVMRPGAHFFLIHFDSRSEEQQILIRQWKKVFPIFSDDHLQSPSERLLNTWFTDCDRRGIIQLEKQHLIGDPIVYASTEAALETLMNFHLESFFNHHPLRDTVLAELTDYLKSRTRPDGSVALTPGCFVYQCKRL